MQTRFFNDISELFSATNIMEHHYEDADVELIPLVFKKVKMLLKSYVPYYYSRTETGCVARCDDLFEDYLVTRKLKKAHFEFYCQVNSGGSKQVEVGVTFVGTKEGDIHCFTINPMTKNSLIISFDIEELVDVLDQVLIFHSDNFNKLGEHFKPVSVPLMLPEYILVYGRDFYLYKSKVDGGYKMPKHLRLDHKAYEKYLTKKAKKPSLPPFKESDSPVKYLFSEYKRLSKVVKMAGGVEHIKAVEESFINKFGSYLDMAN